MVGKRRRSDFVEGVRREESVKIAEGSPWRRFGGE